MRVGFLIITEVLFPDGLFWEVSQLSMLVVIHKYILRVSLAVRKNLKTLPTGGSSGIWLLPNVIYCS